MKKSGILGSFTRVISSGGAQEERHTSDQQEDYNIQEAGCRMASRHPNKEGLKLQHGLLLWQS